MTRSQVLDRSPNRTLVTGLPVSAPRGCDLADEQVSASRGRDASEDRVFVPRGRDVAQEQLSAPRGGDDMPSREPVPERDAIRDDAFSRVLYERHGTVLLSFAVQLCDGDRHRAEDVVQETAVRAWQHQGILDPTTDRVRTWLFTVAHRIVIDHHRARQARPKEVGEEKPADSASPDPADRVVTLRVVLEAMSDLSEGQREVLIYTYYLGYSVDQTARALGLAPGTVKSRAHYAMRELRASLREHAVME
jgi:RNA polymerase sigma-70 factor (ECF subfamily)